MKIFALPFMLSIALTPAVAEYMPAGSPIGVWSIKTEKDPMTDKKKCVAYYGKSANFQVTPDSFAAGYIGRGGIKAYQLRFDDDPAEDMRLASETDRHLSSFVINAGSPDYDRILHAKRLRIQTLTLVSGVVNDDINLSALPQVMKRLSDMGCS